MVNNGNNEQKDLKELSNTEGEKKTSEGDQPKVSETEHQPGAKDAPRLEPSPKPAAHAGSASPSHRGPDEEDGVEDFGAMFEESVKKREMDEGEIIRGVVVGVHKDQVMVDIGDKSEGYVPIQEFLDEKGEPQVAVGQEIEVLVERRDEEDGLIRLSKDKAGKRRVWDDLEDAFKAERPVSGKIAEKVKGGLMVDVGIQAFLPGSQADIRPIRNLEKLLGLDDKFVIIKFNRRRGNVVVSRRAVLEKEHESRRTTTLSHLEKDMLVKGVVKNITDYGAFVDLGGIDGLLHITDMSYGRINHPSEIMKVGDEINIKILRFNRETEKVSLGLKQILPDPWDNVEKKYPLGTIVMGKVISVTDYGAFVELEKGVEGLVHVSELGWSKKRVHPSKVIKPQQEVEAKVLDIDLPNHRISLSIKQAQQNPWDMLTLKYPVGSTIVGKIRNITNFGVFVGVEEGIDGLVHISDLSWTKRVKHPSELFKKGQEVRCQVLNIDKDNERFSLGIKQAQPDPWETVPSKYRPGDEVKGKVVNITDFGVFVELEEGIEGLIHISELSHEKVKDPTEKVHEGQEITAEILNIDTTEHKIRLSIKALERSAEEATYRTYQKQEGDGTSKLGELIQNKLAKIKMAEAKAGKAAEKTEAPETPKAETAETAETAAPPSETIEPPAEQLEPPAEQPEPPAEPAEKPVEAPEPPAALAGDAQPEASAPQASTPADAGGAAEPEKTENPEPTPSGETGPKPSGD